MKTGLITTTVNIPEVLKLYRACDPEVRFFVAGDRKTAEHADHFCDDLGNACYYSLDEQHLLGYKSSALVGPDTISRRNIALLEALKWGADIICMADDDNQPIGRGYFGWMHTALLPVFDGMCVDGMNGWFDVGQWLEPPAAHRGFPIQTNSSAGFKSVTGVKVGVAAGMCLGDPDCSAVTRIANAPVVRGVSEVLRSGVVVNPKTHTTVFNSQNTTFIRELAPCFLMCPQFGRYDDIFASLIAQRVMREHGLHVHFGQPFVWQQRNPHDLIKDLKAELFGMEHVVEFADWLDQLQLITSGSVLNNVARIYDRMEKVSLPWMPPGVSELGQAWCDDLEKVL